MKTLRIKNAKQVTSNILFLSFIILAAFTFSSCEDDGDPGSDDGNNDDDPVVCTNEFDPKSEPYCGIVGLYSQPVFEDVEVTKDLKFSEGSNLTLDLYESSENLDPKRPLVLLSPGGGFSSYNKVEEMEELCQHLAVRGYAAAVVLYSTGERNMDTYVTAAQDQQAAIKFFKTNATEYNVDPEQIFIGGWSSGGLITLVNAFLTEDEIVEIEQESFKTDMQSTVARIGFETDEYPEVDFTVKGAVVMMSYLFDLNVIDAGESALMMINHKDAMLSDGKTTLIDGFTFGGVTQYGTDDIYDHAKQIGFTEGENLEYIRMEDDPGSEPWAANYAPMSSENFDEIVDFFYNNL